MTTEFRVTKMLIKPAHFPLEKAVPSYNEFASVYPAWSASTPMDRQVHSTRRWKADWKQKRDGRADSVNRLLICRWSNPQSAQSYIFDGWFDCYCHA